jgi:hypothetical protein
MFQVASVCPLEMERSSMTNAIDISSEAFRIYTYANGSTFQVAEPSELHVISDDKGTSHRVIDKSGLTHRPERGWVGISWQPRERQPAFVA